MVKIKGVKLWTNEYENVWMNEYNIKNVWMNTNMYEWIDIKISWFMNELMNLWMSGDIIFIPKARVV